MNKINNRVALVTGGYKGIGLAVSNRLAEDGYRVIITGRNESLGNAAAEYLRKNDKDCYFIKADVREEEEIIRLHKAITHDHGDLYIAFNNAGVNRSSLIWQQDLEEYNDIMETNVKGLWLSLKWQIYGMIQRNIRGSIVNNLSVHAHSIVFKGVSIYSASKHAGVALTKSAAIDAAEYGIRVNAIAPGPVNTEMYRKSTKSVSNAESWPDMIPLNRIGETKEVASCVAWLCSPSSRFVNGAVLNIDGGFSAK